MGGKKKYIEMLGSFTEPFTCLATIFQDNSGKFIGARMMDRVVTTRVLGRAKFQSNRHQQQTNAKLFYRLDALPVTQPTVSEY